MLKDLLKDTQNVPFALNQCCGKSEKAMPGISKLLLLIVVLIVVLICITWIRKCFIINNSFEKKLNNCTIGHLEIWYLTDQEQKSC